MGAPSSSGTFFAGRLKMCCASTRNLGEWRRLWIPAHCVGRGRRVPPVIQPRQPAARIAILAPEATGHHLAWRQSARKGRE